jgi:hypothetical protein
VLPPFAVAMRTITFKSGIGYDLDGVCTCDGRPGSARDGAASCKGSANPCDDDGGVDSRINRVFDEYRSLIDLDEALNAATRVEEGKKGVLSVIYRYNGRANDKDVEVGLIASHGIRVPSIHLDGAVGPDADPGSMNYPPVWEGRDTWSLDPKHLLDGIPAFKATGYVSNYHLVVRFPGQAVVFFGGTPVALSSPIAVGRLVPLDANLKPRDPSRPPDLAAGEGRLFAVRDGILGGRVTVERLLAGLGTLASVDPTRDAGSHFCGDGVFSIVKKRFCDERDIASVAALDHDPTTTCDAISVAVAYEAEPALTGELYANPDLPAEDCIAVGDASFATRCEDP